MRFLSFVFLTIGFLFGHEALAWNARGHMMVAAVAWDQMDLDTRVRAISLLKLNPEYSNWIRGVAEHDKDKVAFVMAATWADFIKSAPGYIDDGENPEDSTLAPKPDQNIGYADLFQHRYWHYIDLPFSRDGTPVAQPPAVNALSTIQKFRDTLASEQNDDVKSYDLTWLLHIVGDVHQPLHATSRFSTASPHGDNGGNDVRICESPCRSKLHSFWDSAAGTGDSPTAAIRAADRLEEAPDDAASLDNVRAWVDESFELAKRFVYRAPIGPGNGPFTPTQAYKKRAKSLAEAQIALAGARLARLLNTFLTPESIVAATRE